MLNGPFRLRPFFCLSTIIALMAASMLRAQHEYDVWHFGKGKGMDFRSGAPVLIDTTPCSTLEGSAVICDRETGAFLFAAAGGVIYDSTGAPMPNGDSIIDGGYTSTQGDLIVPDPCNAERYYVFTVDQSGYDGLHRGFFYSIVDMGANGGRGDVALRNRQLLATASEHLTAVMHANGHDYWIITHTLGGRSFQTFLLSGAGLLSVPVVSVVGSTHGDPVGSGLWPLGYLKSSPDGRRLALAAMYIGLLELYDFDPATGVVSNPVRLLGNDLPIYTFEGLHYGVSFSPDGRLLYAGINRMDYTNYRLMQWSLEPDIPDSIIGSALLVADNAIAPRRAMLALQTGPDGRIYAMMSDGWVGVIERPNERGFWCGFRERLLHPFIPPTNPATGVMGLPNNIDDRRFLSRPRPRPPVTITDVAHRDSCYGADVTAADGFARYHWSTGDAGRRTRAILSGRYVVTAVDSNGCPSSDSIDITTGSGIGVTIEPDGPLEFCEGESLTLTARALGPVSGFSWSTGDTTRAITVRSSGLYIVRVDGAGGCAGFDTMTVQVFPQRTLRTHIDRDVKGRPGDTVVILLHLDEPPADRIDGRLLLTLQYDTLIMRPLRPESRNEGVRMTSGTLLDGWRVVTLSDLPGRIGILLTPSPTSPPIATTGMLLRLRFETHMSMNSLSPAVMDAELPFTLELPDAICTDITEAPGSLLLNICGAVHRMITGTDQGYTLDAPRPNPFNPTTEIAFSLGLDGPTRLEILDMRGAIAAILIDEHLPAGAYRLTWNAYGFPSGLYYYRLSSGDWMRMKSMILVR